MSNLILRIAPLQEFRTFKGHEKGVRAVAVFPDERRMVTGSDDKTLRLWDLKTGVVLKKMEGHRNEVWALAVSHDGQLIASGDASGELIVWHGETGESLNPPIKAHSGRISSLDFSPGGTPVLATGSYDFTTKLWYTKTWQPQGNPFGCGYVRCVRYSPSGELPAIATNTNIQIYHSGTRECVAKLEGHTLDSCSLAWSPNSTRLLSGGGDNIIHEWDALTWQPVGVPWTGHTSYINAIAINPAGTLAASASRDKHVHLWDLADRRTVAIFERSSSAACVAFSVDGRRILSGGEDNTISEWVVPKGIHPKILTITTARDACIDGDLSTAEQLLTQELVTNVNNHTSYAHRAFVMARKHDLDHALQDAIKSVSIQPSLTGYISKGIAFCGKGHLRDARAAFNVAFMYTDQNPETVHFLLLIKAIALFNANRHEEANLLVRELAAGCPNADILACRVVQAYLSVQLGINALDGARYAEATDHFTAAVDSGAFSSALEIHTKYEELVVLFGWDLKSLCLTAHQKRCQAFLSEGKIEEALESHKYMMDSIDETTKASCLDWTTEFQQQCSELAVPDDRILGTEIPGQDQDGYDVEPDFFRGMHEHSQISRPRPRQRVERLKKFRLAITRNPHSTPQPAPALPTTLSSTTPPTTFKTKIRHLFTRRPDYAAPPIVEVPFGKGKLRNAAAGDQGKDEDLVPDEYLDDPDIQDGEHEGGCYCC